MRALLQSERGTAIITAIALMTVMSGVALAAYSVSDTQQTQSLRERQHEGSFNLAEATLSTQTYILARRWPGSAINAYPTCTQSVADPLRCPQPAQVADAYNTSDFAAGTTWTTTVWDDVTGNFYDRRRIEDTSNPNVARWDKNGNKTVWVRSRTAVRGRNRAIVALIKVQTIPEELPKKTVIAGHFQVRTSGNAGAYVYTNPDATGDHDVTVRCNPDPPRAGCADYDTRGDREQISPKGAVEEGYVGETALPADMTERLKERAINDGNYWATGCPPIERLTGKVVYVENCSASYTANYTWNSSAEPPGPGILIWARGTLKLAGRSEYWGIVYHLNLENRSDNVIELTGGITIQGGVFVDGPGGVLIGSNRVNINYFNPAFTLVSSYGTAGLIQNSWREVAAN